MNKAKKPGCAVNLSPFVMAWVVTFAILKITGTYSVSWWVVFAPMLISWAFIFLGFLMFVAVTLLALIVTAFGGR